jgi:hypothetical protein
VVKFLASVGLLLAGAAELPAQLPFLSVPRQSQRASVTQRVALTDITVVYHRPLVGGRKVWGAMVPEGQVWRAGANENTTFEATDPVMVEGKLLPKGIYGLHMIPSSDTWTVIFSRTASAWGSFTYDPKEDVLRVTVKPVSSEMHEALTYDFDDVKPDSAVVTLRWEKLAVPFTVKADPEATLANIRNQFRSSAQYTWEAWDEAAVWCLGTKTNLEEALGWTARSMQVEERFENLMTRSQILEALNKPTESAAARAKAMEVGNAIQVYMYGRQLQIGKKKAEAVAIFRNVARRFPDHRIGHIAKARAAVADGDFPTALKETQAAQAGAPDTQKSSLETLKKRIENKEDING